MSELSVADRKTNPHLPHNALELPGAPPVDAADPEAAIRALISEQECVEKAKAHEAKKRAKRAALPDLEPVAESDRPVPEVEAVVSELVANEPKPKKRARRAPRLSRLRLSRLRLPRLRFPRLSLPKLPKLPALPRLPALPDRVKNYRPTRKHMIIAAVALVMLVRPLLIPAILFFGFWIGLIVYLTLGPDRVREIVANAWIRLAERNPDKAERLRKKADALALRWDAVIDRLPGSLADRLALPDFSRPVGLGEDEPDPFDKLKSQH